MSWRIINLESGAAVGSVDAKGGVHFDALPVPFNVPSKLPVLHTEDTASAQAVVETYVSRGDDFDLYITALALWFQQHGYTLEPVGMDEPVVDDTRAERFVSSLEDFEVYATEGEARAAIRADVYRAREGGATSTAAEVTKAVARFIKYLRG